MSNARKVNSFCRIFVRKSVESKKSFHLFPRFMEVFVTYSWKALRVKKFLGLHHLIFVMFFSTLFCSSWRQRLSRTRLMFPRVVLLRTEVHWTELNWTELNWTELNRTELNWTELNWTKMNLTERNWTELKWAELLQRSWFDPLENVWKSLILIWNPNQKNPSLSHIKQHKGKYIYPIESPSGRWLVCNWSRAVVVDFFYPFADYFSAVKQSW